jgi:biotin carboxyl carrier protein
LRPMILIPASLLTGLNSEQLTAVLTHELAHIRRYDHLFLLIQRLIEALLFFHPAVWYLGRCIARERENSCDDQALAAGTDRLVYSLSLLRVAELNWEGAVGNALLTGLAADGDEPSQLRRRIARLLGVPFHRVTAGPPVPFVRSALIAGILLFVLAAGVTFWMLRPDKADRDRQAAVHEQPKTAAVTGTSHPGAGTDKEEIADAAPSDILERPTVRLVPGRPETVVVTGGDGPRKLQTVEVAETPARFLRLPGSIALDPNRLARIRARINGEIVEIASVEPDPSQPAGGALRRTIRFGDRVRKGDILAILEGDERDAQRRAAVPEGANRAGETGPSRIEILAPIGGAIVEKNVAAGSIVDRDNILFQIADLSQLMVFAQVAEDDRPAIRSLPPEMRRWTIHWKRELHRQPIDATFDLNSQIIDPAIRSAIITGWIDNSDLSLVGQSITAVIDIPADPSVAEIPEHALIEEGSSFVVFVKDGEGEEFTRRKVAVRRWAGGSAFIGLRVTDEERSRGIEALHVGEQILYLYAREVEAEWKNLRSRAAPP